jgi:hypothetical protein
MILVAPHSAKLVESHGSRFTLLAGYLFCLLGFIAMLLLWKENIPFWKIGLAYALVGVGVGLAGTPASHSLTGSVPISREGMASGTADLQRDFGGAIMTSIFGTLLTAGYAGAFAAQISGLPSADQQQISSIVVTELQKSYSSAALVAKQNPEYATQIISSAKISFLSGADWTYLAGIIAILIGAAIIFFKYPKKNEEKNLLTEYQDIDTKTRERD